MDTNDTNTTETMEQEVERRSVVATTYKVRYRERAAIIRGKKGVDKRVLADSSGDWLALELAALIRPTKKAAANLELFEEICRANDVDLSKLPRTSPGWQGRLRMNGSQMLRTKIAEAGGEFRLPDGRVLNAPKSWVAKHAGH